MMNKPTEFIGFIRTKLRPGWTLEGFDTYASERYCYPGRWWTEKGAVRAAKRYLRRIEKTQPTSTSGGQDGIQDQVFVRRPDDTMFRVRDL